MNPEKRVTFADRLNFFLSHEQLSKAELSRQTGVDKSSITHYSKGDWEAKQDVVYKIASTFKLNEAWLMGYDVPMYKNSFSDCIISDELLLCIPFISTISLFCQEHDIDISPVLHYYQSPNNIASLKNLLTYGAPKGNDRIYFSKYLGISVEDAVRSVKNTPSVYLPLIMTRSEINTIIAMRENHNVIDD